VSSEVAVLATQATPYVVSAIKAYGGAVLADVRDQAADAAVGRGRRILQRLFGTRASDEDLPEALVDVTNNPSDEDAVAALRLSIRKALETDAELRRDLAAMLPSPEGPVAASGERSIAAQSISGIAVTGDSSSIMHFGGSQNNITFQGGYGPPATNHLAPRIVQIATLLPPGTGYAVTNRTFEDIHFYGPAMMLPVEGFTCEQCSFDRPTDDIEDMLWEINPRYVLGAVVLKSCVFRRCRFTQISLMGDRESLDYFKANIDIS
jgi:hypothetical protein